MRFASIIVLLYSIVPSALAHGDLHGRIEALSARIKQVPQDLELYQQRGELLLQHEEYTIARRDFERCRRLGYTSARLYYCLGKVYFHLQKFRRSKHYLDISLDLEPTDIKSLGLMAMCHVAKREYTGAIKQYSLQIKHSVRTRPSVYLDLARVYSLKGDLDMAIQTLKCGISRLGLLPAFSSQLLLYYKMGQYDQLAIELQTELIRVCMRKEFALFERALLFYTQDNYPAAQADLVAATDCIEKLPDHIRKGSIIRRLVHQIEEQWIKFKLAKDD
ncbi:MAG: hypothetical protein HKN87_20745 [Saprospiraceae bacterium]|nr:hypothetical protein [Saprospiraceae bacterium]